MRRRLTVALFLAVFCLASFADASGRGGRQRPVRRGDSAVEMVVTILYGTDDKGNQYTWVGGTSRVPLTLGTKFTGWVQKPGESEFSYLTSSTVESGSVGLYRSMTLYSGYGWQDFYDVMPDGTRQYWLPGVAPFRIDIETTKGVKTSVLGKVPVRLDELRAPLGPLQQAIPSTDGRSVLLLGVFPTQPVAMLYHWVGMYIVSKPVVVYQNQFTVPNGFFGPELPLTVCSGYPNAECSTVEVDIPEPPPTEGAKQLR